MTQTLAQKTVEVLKRLSQDTDGAYAMARREWIYGTEGKVFVRVNRRVFAESPTQFTPVFDLANIEIKERHQGKGIFQQVLRAMEGLALEQSRTMVVENVFSEHLEKCLPGYGYHLVEGSDPPMFWKSVEELRAQPSPNHREAFLKTAFPSISDTQVAALSGCLSIASHSEDRPDGEAIYRLGRKNIKALLKAMYPHRRFVVRFPSQRNLHMQQLNIHWPDLPDAPSMKDVERVAAAFVHVPERISQSPDPGSSKKQFGHVFMVAPTAMPPTESDLVAYRKRQRDAALPDPLTTKGKRPRM